MNRRRFGLRARVIAAFGIGTLLLSVLLSSVTYSLTRNNVIEDRKALVFESAATNAGRLDERLTAVGGTDYTQLLGNLIAPEEAELGLFVGDYTFVDPLNFSESQLDESFRARVEARQPTRMAFAVDGEPHYGVALPLPQSGTGGTYIETHSMADVDSTLDNLLLTLLGASAVTTILGLGFGVYVGTRLFSPLADISAAADEIAHGDLSTRLAETDDPDLHSLIASFNEMTSALESRIERDARFASDVSHELRSPLMTLTGSVAVLEGRRDELPERAQLALDLLSSDIRRFKDLVEDLLEISRFDVGAVELDREEVMLNEFVRHAVAAASGGERDVPILTPEITEGIIVEIDKRRVAQVIRNLSENADKYANGLRQVRLLTTDDDLRIELEDDGPGVPVDERELIFERFARGSEGGRRGSGTGVGLGLSLVAEHLRLHGGSIHVTDRLDGERGARFVINLPDVVVE